MNGAKTETRRKTARAKVGSEIAYLNFDSGNGAIVIDVSPEGLGFQAADPLQRNASLVFRLCTPDLPNIDLAGEIVWLDETHKRGGLRLHVPATSHPVLQQWLRKHLSSVPEAEAPADAPPSSAPSVEPSPKSTEGDPVRRASVPNFTPRPPVPNPPRPNPLGRGPIFVSEWEYPAEKSHTGRNVLVVCVIVVLGLLASGSYYFGSRREMGAVLIRLGQSLSGSSSQAPLRTLAATDANALPPARSAPPLQPLAPASSGATLHSSASAASSAAASSPENGFDSRSANSDATPAAKPANATPRFPRPNVSPIAAPPHAAGSAILAGHRSSASPSRTSTAANNASAAVSSPVGVSPDYGQPEVAEARKLLRDSNPEDSAVAANLLWSAVGKGNTQAEMTLANLYLGGHGAVRQNCDQAEALLNAAQSAGVPGASAKLEELQTYGCR
ncbi:MAG: PilZ domain-containing protein [Candidatus Acidiferrales bacterium]